MGRARIAKIPSFLNLAVVTVLGPFFSSRSPLASDVTSIAPYRDIPIAAKNAIGYARLAENLRLPDSPPNRHGTIRHVPHGRTLDGSLPLGHLPRLGHVGHCPFRDGAELGHANAG